MAPIEAAVPYRSTRLQNGTAGGIAAACDDDVEGRDMTDPVIIGDATLYCGDCMDILPTLGPADAVVTDPPYGIGEAAGKNASRGNLAVAKDYGDDGWDNEPIDMALMALVRAAGKWNIIFGGNYYVCPPASCWLVWDKINGTNDFADCELAWTNLPKAVRRIRFMWNGMLRAHREPRGDHPTQKPIGVMKWCIEQLPEPNETILDPFMGSGTTGVATCQLGKRFIGIERNPRYFDIACRRIEEAQKQADLFVPKDWQKRDSKANYELAIETIRHKDDQ